MAKTKRKASYRSTLVKQLGAVFEVGGFGLASMSRMDVAGLLNIKEEEVSLMVKLGAFGPVAGPRELPSARAVVEFLENYGREWALVRFEKQVADLRDRVDAYGDRA